MFFNFRDKLFLKLNYLGEISNIKLNINGINTVRKIIQIPILNERNFKIKTTFQSTRTKILIQTIVIN